MMGRPPKYETVEELQDKIGEYFDKETYCKPFLDAEGKPITNRKGEVIYDIKPPTVSGLAYFLGFAERQSLYDYKKKTNFSYTIKRATLLIEKYAEEQLTQGNSTGAIFWLKNKGWTDKTVQEVHGDALTTINIRGLKPQTEKREVEKDD